MNFRLPEKYVDMILYPAGVPKPCRIAREGNDRGRPSFKVPSKKIIVKNQE
jgi:hypothetical protein